ncbi:hypothetical protein BZG36_02702 [Bifiguratus adelaidae]|uniref:Cytochrome b5 heme-binding domain-containing protein n=1 Tax=Bifiguratus adelaidae TaxID=1938954 RepID=A0A261Y1U3_9FUNG|nr:hypothetical protein BZG36_02702 [Bifiguratus adelaidae]
MAQTYTVDEVAKHNTAESAWLIIHGKIYDVTRFLDEHPGGKKVLLRAAGTDASKQFDQFHNAAIMAKFGPGLEIGTVGSAQVEKKSENSMLATDDQFGDMIPFGDPMWYQDWYSPYYNDTHRAVRKHIREFVDKEIMPYCHEWDEAKKVPPEVFVKAAKAGVFAATMGCHIPEEYMTYGLPAGLKFDQFDAFHEFIVTDEIARCGSVGVVWALIGGLTIGLPPIIQFATKEVKDKCVKPCIAGEKFCALAITEPYAGSDVAGLKCEAKDMGDYWLVNGEKKWITNGVYADFFTTACRTGEGISLLLIERTMPGVTTRQMQCSGVWASGTAYITFEDVKVPKSNLIGKLNNGFKHIMHNFNHERMGICIQANRMARICVEESLKYAHKRKTFGKTLIEHPVIRNKLAHMIRQVEATHGWMENLMYQTEKMPAHLRPLRLGGPIALLKAQCTVTFEYCAREAAQIWGGLAYTRGGQAEKIERLYREVRAYAIPGGSEEIMLDLGVRQAVKMGQAMGAKL